MSDKKINVKFLLSRALAGSFIGLGGKSVKDLIAVTDARILVSGTDDVFPGTNDRVVLISGTLESVTLAAILIWEMIALFTKHSDEKRKDIEWSPKTVAPNLGANDSLSASGKIAIPALAGGQILGKGGVNLKSITEESGATISMTSKDEALFTQERVITITGPAGHCMKATELIIAKLADQQDIPGFVNRGTSYSSPLNSNFGILPSTGVAKFKNPRTGGRNRDKTVSTNPVDDGVGESTITLSLPNEVVGNIIGRQGSTMREIIGFSGAKVTVSPREELVDGNRLVTITGSPAAAQSAHILITQRLSKPANPPPRRPRVKV